jgi:serine/threonine-protein kinase
MKRCPACQKEFKDHIIFCPFDGQSLISDNQKDQFVGSLFDDKYHIDEKVGEGGMGMVFKATHVLMDSTVAIKMLHPHLSSDRMALERFRREARAAAQIRHPNAVAVIDFGVTKNTGIAYLVMEFLEGADLRTRLKEQKQIDCLETCSIMQQVCSAVQVAHSRGIIHRDLKPDNIWLLKNYDGTDTVKVLDFGIAKLLSYNGGVGGGNTLTQQGMIVGTPYYMSPEQCQGEELDARSDIYSLGIIIYEMLTGEVPFRGPTPMVVAHKHITEFPASLRARHPEIPSTVEDVVFRALNKGREDRQESALQLGDELEAALVAAGMEVTLKRSRTPQSPFSKTIHTTTPRETSAYDEPTAPALNVASAGDATKMIQSSPAPAAAPDQPVAAPQSRRAIIFGSIAALVIGLIAAIIWWPGRTETSTEQPVVVTPPTVTNNETPPGMVLVPAGRFIMGNNASDDEAEKPEREVSLKAYYIDQYEVTNEEYYKFLQETKRAAPPGWSSGKYPEGKEKYPVVNVAWSDAVEYARWAGKRLPTEEEWEYAARGTDKRLYPWGNDFDSDKVISKESGRDAAMMVGSFLAGRSQFGVLDMVGNVAEWTGSDYRSYPNSRANPLPGFKSVRGCSFRCDRTQLVLTRRYAEPADSRRPSLGFRCAKDAPSQ